MLAFANTMFLDLLHEDGLLIAAKGLGIEEVFYSMLKVYSDPGNLVLVMGTNEEEENYFTNLLAADGVTKLPKKVTTEYSIPDRQRLYLDGGVLFVTTRIMVVDMLTDRMPMSLITGILIYKAHQTLDSCQESFVLRLFRQKNKTGFVKAFSASPTSFKTGLCDMTRLMKTLFVKELYLWPRFHVTVVESLSPCTPEVIELHVEMTEKMRTMQTSVLDLINFSLSELRRLNPHLLVDELTVENAISKSFHKLLLRELEPVWHRLSWKTKQLVTDIKTLHSILVHLTQYDCVTFHVFVSGLRTTENAMKSAGWMLLDAAETLFLTARSRVYGDDAKKTKRLKTEGDEKHSEEKDSETLFDFDINPKWEAFTEIMSEIRTDMEKNHGDNVTEDKILVLTADQRVATQLEDFLFLGPQRLLTRIMKTTILADTQPDRREFKHKGKGKKSEPVTTISDRADYEDDAINPGPNENLPCMPLIRSLQIGSFNIYRLFEDVKPRYVILYDVEMSVVRQLEVYQAKHPDFKVKVYFLMYSNSVEEQAYLTSLRREKEAFEFLIKEKSTLVMPEILDEQEAEVECYGTKNNLLTRKGGGAAVDTTVPKVIVDMREFRSELPSILHKRGIVVEPVTLEVGDYILSPEICVERKSISDLIGSLNSGRLYNQATAMTRFYAKPMLLIEFDQNKPFALQGKYYLSRDISSSDITARLQLLTIHFPKLRILWSPSPHATGELFEELKKGRDQPDPTKAAGVTIDAVDEFNSEKYNPAVMDLLSKLPGVTTKNIFALMNRLVDFSDLLEQSVEDLTQILGHSGNAQELYDCLHSECIPLEEREAVSKKSKSQGSRFKSSKDGQKKNSSTMPKK